MIEPLSERTIQVRDARTAVGISYRQINDWDARGVLGAAREGERGWRRFSVRDLIRMTILKQLRDFGIPLNRMKKLSEWMRDEKVAEYIVMKMVHGFRVYLYTDLVHNFGVYSDLELPDFVNAASLEGAAPPYPRVLLPLNKLVNRIFHAVGLPKQEVQIRPLTINPPVRELAAESSAPQGRRGS